MAFINYNANPSNNRVGDCVIRAISKLTGMSWEKTYTEIALKGFDMYDMPSSNAVWIKYLIGNGYDMIPIPNTCPDCYTVIDFCNDHPNGSYLVATGSHVIAIENGDYYDTWDSGDEIPIYYFRKENENA